VGSDGRPRNRIIDSESFRASSEKMVKQQQESKQRDSDSDKRHEANQNVKNSAHIWIESDSSGADPKQLPSSSPRSARKKDSFSIPSLKAGDVEVVERFRWSENKTAESNRQTPNCNGNETAGVGMVIQRVEDKIIVGEVLQGGEAEGQGVLIGDEVIVIDGKRVADLKLNQVCVCVWVVFGSVFVCFYEDE
jgi:C-terminal processing protease CtpA/Prc